MESTFPRLRWLALLQIVALFAGTLDAGSILQALQSAGFLAPGVVSLLLFTLRASQAYSQIDTTGDDFVHTMGNGRSVRQPGLWERVW